MMNKNPTVLQKVQQASSSLWVNNQEMKINVKTCRTNRTQAIPT